MTPLDFITAFFCQVDDHLPGLPTHPHATLWPSAIVTLGLLHALKGGSNRAFSRWLTRDYRALFPRLPERTRLALTMAAFNVRVQWHGFRPTPSGFVPLSIADFSLSETNTMGYYNLLGGAKWNSFNQVK
jgi:hypothetical protein